MISHFESPKVVESQKLENWKMENSRDRQKANRTTAFSVLACVVFMIGMSYAAVPLYRIFCEVTGYDGTPRRAEKAPDMVSEKTIRVRFDANVSSDMNWDFKPVEQMIDLKIGENRLAFYEAKNNAQHPVTGTAVFKVMPEMAGSYFSKIQCFCFQEQTLAAGQKVDMPVSFFIDPAILKDPDAKDINEITLSYSFSPVAEPAQKKVSQKSENVKTTIQN